MAGEVLRFMCIPEVVGVQAGVAGEEKSFEELRMTTYVHAYQTTGRLPPAPLAVPEVFRPTIVNAAAGPSNSNLNSGSIIPGLNLASLGSTSALGSASTTPTNLQPKPNTDPALLPEWHVFNETPGGVGAGGDQLQSITAEERYSGFSFEHLRYVAYLAGKINPPPHVKMVYHLPPIQSNPSVLFGGTPSISTSSSTGSTTSTLNRALGGSLDTGTETFLSISSKVEFAGCSFEELRLAALATGYTRDVTANELLGLTAPNANPNAPTSTSLFNPTSAPASGLFGSTPNTAASSLFGSTAAATQGLSSAPNLFATPSSNTTQVPIPGGGIFGSNTNQSVQGQGLLGSTPNTATSSLFGSGSSTNGGTAQGSGPGIFGSAGTNQTIRF